MQRFNILLGMLLGTFLLGMPLGLAQEKVDYASKSLRIEKIYNQLDLTADQKSQLDDNKEKNRSAMKEVRRQLKANRQALRDELMKAQLDMEKVNALHEQTKSLQAQLQDSKLSSILAVRSILTPEQFTKFLELLHQSRQAFDKKETKI